MHIAHLDGEISPIDVVAKEQILGRRRRTANLEQLHEIEELPVYVATD